MRKYLEKYPKNRLMKIFYFFLLIEIIILYFSFSSSSYMSFFWPDFIYYEYIHNLSLQKNIFEVLSASNNFNSPTLIILNPYLNPLSFLNYNLKSLFDYKLYLAVLRFCELSIIILHVNYFIKKISIKEIVIIFFLYIIYLGTTRIFDHHSHINFPIMVFCFFHGLGLYFQKNNFLFFILLTIGNIWSYFLYPIYFIITCFAPLLFYYAYFFFKNDYKKIFLIFFANLIVAIPFILIALGTARLGVPDIFPEAHPHQNFTILKSKTFFILSVITMILAIKLIYEKKEYFFSFLFLFINFLTLAFGFLYKYKIDSWKMPHPEYFDASFQNIYIFIIFMIIYFSKKDLFTYSLLTVFFLGFCYSAYSFTNQYFNFNKLNPTKIIFANKNKTHQKKFFWNKIDEEYLFKKDLMNKKVLINMPNFGSDFFENSFTNKSSNQAEWEQTKYYYNSDFKGTLSHFYFWKNKITTNEAHSHYLDVSSVLANLENFSYEYIDNPKWKNKDKVNFSGNKLIERQTIPLISSNSALLEFYQVEYILSDVPLNYELYKKYDFDKYIIYLYKFLQSKKNITISKINIFSNFDSYKKNIKKINNELFLLDSQKSMVKNIKKFCDVKTIINQSNKTIFDINTNNETCIAIFPTTFSHNNNFLFIDKNKKKQIKCDSFRAQYFFHGCIIKKSTKIELVKNNIIFYSFGSFKDFLDLKKLNIH